MKLTLVASKSTRKFFPNIEDVFIVKHSPTVEFVTEFAGSRRNKIIAVGGGAVIDTAKILGENIEAYPTTAAGSVTSDHAVYWDGNIKKSFQSEKPKVIKIVPEFLKDLPKEVIKNTFADAYAHICESYWSKNRTDKSIKYVKQAVKKIKKIIDINDVDNLVNLIEAGNLAGKAIGITQTNVMHALSYPMTSTFNIPHGKALRMLIPKIVPYYKKEMDELDLDFINRRLFFDVELKKGAINFTILQGLKYPKIHNTIKTINRDILFKLLTT